MSSRRTAHLLSRKCVDRICAIAHHACTGSVHSSCIEVATVCGRVGLPGTGGRPGDASHTEPEDARPHTPRSHSVHAPKVIRSDVRGSWQLWLVQLWKEPPLHPDVIVDHGQSAQEIAKATKENKSAVYIAEVCVGKRRSQAVSTCAWPRSVWTQGPDFVGPHMPTGATPLRLYLQATDYIGQQQVWKLRKTPSQASSIITVADLTR
jgi:hypothetical protein